MMTPEDKQRLEACTREIAEILHRNAEVKDVEQLQTLEGIEIAVREQMLENVNPKVGNFLLKKQWDKREGDVKQVITLFRDCKFKRAINFVDYIRKHRLRMPEYSYLQQLSLP
jgi:hypothetical protein